MNKQQVGVIGLAVMGKNLALNIESRGFSVSVYNRSREKTDDLVLEAKGRNLIGTYSIPEFVDSLEVPRKIIIMVKAGTPVDDTIEQLVPYLDKGDILIDGGNSFFEDTIRRNKALESAGIRFIGAGVSGGEEGALKGPAIMPGGQEDAYRLVEPILTAISAKVEGEPCCTYIGADGSGHYVKMVHNGIEYGDMQLISEAYFVLKHMLNLDEKQLHLIFDQWNDGELDSYLIDITQDIFTKYDDVTGKPILDVILDKARQKGTGKWTSLTALDLDVATPTITEAVFARCMSAIKKQRVNASKILKGPDVESYQGDPRELIERVRRALYASKICSYAQGFSLLQASSKRYGWNLDYGKIAMIFRGGCIIRAQFLNRIKEAYDRKPDLENLMLDSYFADILTRYQKDWREVVCVAVKNGLAVPAISSALAYYDSYRTERLPANLIQAQRDYFGAHTYERVDEPGSHHYRWF